MNQKITLIDDDGLTNYINRTILSRHLPGVEIEEFTNTRKALDFLTLNAREDNLEYLIFLDINMPELNGWQVLEAIEREIPTLNASVVMLTSSIDKADRDKAFSYDRVISFVTKPLDREKVFGILDTLAQVKSKLRGEERLEA